MHKHGRTVALFCVAGLFASAAYAGQPANHDSAQADTKQVLVFVTGSHIPQRVKLYRVGTTTFSPLRIIDRWEIDQTGRHTTAGALANEPSVRVIGN